MEQISILTKNQKIILTELAKIEFIQKNFYLKEGVWVDSLFDIAINKLITIIQRTDIKDFVDFYFLEPKFGVWDLIEGVGVKFHQKIEPYLLASDFLKVEDFEFLPKVVRPLSLEELKVFFRKLAKKVGMRAVEK